jgi:putative hydrolase of HD superfamily
LSSKIEQVFSFIIEMDKLKGVLRKTKPTGLHRYENSAEHSWQVCLFAYLLAGQAKFPVDISRVIEVLLVHDIPEIDVGDQIVYQGHSDIRVAEEFKAAQRIFGLLPDQQAKWCMDRWQEYEDRETNEAIFSYAIDRLMPLIHNLHNNGQSWKENNVTLERVLKFNAPIGEACPEVWDYMQGLLANISDSPLFDENRNN